MPQGKIYFLVLALIFVPLSAYADANTKPYTTYTVGVVPQFDARRIHSTWRPILDTLEQRTGLKFILRSSYSISAFEQEFLKGEFDFAYMNAFHMLHANRDQGYLPLVRDIANSLAGILVVAKDSPIQHVSELAGKTIAFPDPNAFGASLMIRSDLRNLFNIHFKPRYVQTHSSVYLNVALNEVVAGGGVQRTLSSQSKELHDRLRILYKTREVISHPFAAHARVFEDDKIKIQAALLEIATTTAGKRLFSKIPIQQMGKTTMKEYLDMKKMSFKHLHFTE